MLRQIKTAAERSSETLLGDFIGAAALMVTLRTCRACILSPTLMRVT